MPPYFPSAVLLAYMVLTFISNSSISFSVFPVFNKAVADHQFPQCGCMAVEDTKEDKKKTEKYL